MAHTTVETRLAQPAREVTDAKDHTETDHAQGIVEIHSSPAHRAGSGQSIK